MNRNTRSLILNLTNEFGRYPYASKDSSLCVQSGPCRGNPSSWRCDDPTPAGTESVCNSRQCEKEVGGVAESASRSKSPTRLQGNVCKIASQPHIEPRNRGGRRIGDAPPHGPASQPAGPGGGPQVRAPMGSCSRPRALPLPRWLHHQRKPGNMGPATCPGRRHLIGVRLCAPTTYVLA